MFALFFCFVDINYFGPVHERPGKTALGKNCTDLTTDGEEIVR